MSNHQCLQFTGVTPNVKEFPAFLPKVGFRPLSNATPEDLPAGSIIVLYNPYTCFFETVVVKSREDGIFFYCHQTGRSLNTWNHAILGDVGCNGYLYKVIS